MIPTVKEIVGKYLQENGFDGLFRSGECGCDLSILMDCNEPSEHCQAGYKQPSEDPDYDYMICETREAT